jgi:beta-lactamase regulating signal transducer with metallopeptidase domain
MRATRALLIRRYFPSASPSECCTNHHQSDTFSSLSTSLKGSAGRLTRMAAQGNKVAVLKLAGIVIAVVVVLWWIWGLFV